MLPTLNPNDNVHRMILKELDNGKNFQDACLSVCIDMYDQELLNSSVEAFNLIEFKSTGFDEIVRIITKIKRIKINNDPVNEIEYYDTLRESFKYSEKMLNDVLDQHLKNTVVNC